jgi:hypothetical protein
VSRRTAAARCPAVRHLFPCRARLPRPAPYWGVKAGASIRREGREPTGYKGRLLPMRRPTKPFAIDLPRRALISQPYHHRPSALATSHDPTPPPRAIARTAGAFPPPEHKLQRQAPPATAASRHREHPYPVCEHKSSPSSSSYPTPSPAKGATGAAQFRRAAPPSMPRDYISSPSFFPGSFS